MTRKCCVSVSVVPGVAGGRRQRRSAPAVSPGVRLALLACIVAVSHTHRHNSARARRTTPQPAALGVGRAKKSTRQDQKKQNYIYIYYHTEDDRCSRRGTHKSHRTHKCHIISIVSRSDLNLYRLHSATANTHTHSTVVSDTRARRACAGIAGRHTHPLSHLT